MIALGYLLHWLDGGGPISIIALFVYPSYPRRFFQGEPYLLTRDIFRFMAVSKSPMKTHQLLSGLPL